MFKKFAVAATLSLLASASFAATPVGVYGGLDVGSTKIDDFGSSKTSVGGFLGYGFHRFFAVELGYRQLGKWDFGPVEFKANQTHLTVVGAYPLNERLDVFGRFGRNYVRTEASANGFTAKEDDDGALYGVGLNYDFAPNLSGRVEAQKPSTDSVNYGASVVWKF